MLFAKVLARPYRIGTIRAGVPACRQAGLGRSRSTRHFEKAFCDAFAIHTLILLTTNYSLYTSPMMQVDFSDEERLRRGAVSGRGTGNGLSGWFIRHGFASDERQANQVLVIILFGILAVTAAFALVGLGII